jgi:hypothetical protein
MIYRHLALPLRVNWRLLVFCGVLYLFVTSCGRPGVNGFNSAQKMMIATNVWLHRTSGDGVTIADRDGMGLVYGNVTQIGYDAKNREQLIVAYLAFPSDSTRTNGTDSSTKLASIDLKTGKVTNISEVDRATARSLKGINSFFR